MRCQSGDPGPALFFSYIIRTTQGAKIERAADVAPQQWTLSIKVRGSPREEEGFSVKELLRLSLTSFEELDNEVHREKNHSLDFGKKAALAGTLS